ncbi:alanine racemase [Candidatus Gottesmanbacteria bacterium RIFCSPHIGHO2_02_FULL_39_14]|uniref:Alanine racemase n=1 Tax=Candidatus Gottesmanbacteria bacterium RIFCSPHIGHO2_02_FULL_39_14 TaxID=1798383 RepID=A0A1F5ZUS9_9BACT|nr:MAG: alanine racemase [Candidatus Gottesmanbacteria bacterium RIFCSPHIGHO2_02_FULL_39_14]
MGKSLERLVWAEINISNFLHNLRSVRKITGPKVMLMAVVKANAYGHGAPELAKSCQHMVDYFGVVCLYEARRLREAGIKKPILILNYIDSASLKTCLELDLTLNIMDEKLLRFLDKLAYRRHQRAKIHVKIDTGMHRLGLLPDQALKFIPKIENYKNIYLEGIFTHFATSDEKDLSFTNYQLTIFQKIISKLKKQKLNIPIIHSANSAATLRLKKSHYNMVRPGIILYGLPPSTDFQSPFSPEPVMFLKTKIVQIRRINKGETVGYGRTWTATKPTLVAALPVGYADGFTRAPNNWGQVLVGGTFAPLIGRVSMDQSSVDITQIPDAKVGDEVVLIGKQGNQEITAGQVAQRVGTINYEITSSLAARVSRVYIL